MKKQLPMLAVNDSRVLLRASQNRVLYPFVRQVLQGKKNLRLENLFRQCQNLFQEGQEKEKKLKKTAQIMKRVWDGKVEYYLFKTIQITGSLPSDIDVIFRSEQDYQLSIKLMKQAGWVYQGDYCKGAFHRFGLAVIEPHLTVNWGGSEFFSKDFLIQKPQKSSFLGIAFKTLNNQAALGIQLAQIVFDNQYLTIRDLVNVKDLMGKVENLKAIEKEALDYGWFEALKKSLLLVRKAESATIRLPYWLAPIDYCQALVRKALFDRRHELKIHYFHYFTRILFYLWKRGRFLFKSKPSFVNSWLY